MTRQRSCTWLGGLALLVTACSGGSDSPSAPPPQPPPPSNDVVVVNVDDNFFDPKSVQIEPGQTVRWVLRGRMTNHTVTERSDLDGTESWDSGFVFQQEGDTFEHTFVQADDGRTFEYLCETHWVSDEMQGSVRVGENAPPPNPGY